MTLLRPLRACEKSASPAVQVPPAGNVCLSHQLPVCPLSVSVAVVVARLPAVRRAALNVTSSTLLALLQPLAEYAV